nr:hypothetical protein [Tanacetum cinerariifolium]
MAHLVASISLTSTRSSSRTGVPAEITRFAIVAACASRAAVTLLATNFLMTHNDSFAFVHELKQEMHADLKYIESLKKEIDELESDKAEFSNMYDILLQECVSNDGMCSYLHSLSDLDAHTELQCLYLHKVKECDYLA